MSKMKGHVKKPGPPYTAPRPNPRKRPARIVDRKPLQIPVTRHRATGGRRRHEVGA